MPRRVSFRKWAYTEKEKGFQDFLRYWKSSADEGTILKIWLKEPIEIRVSAKDLEVRVETKQCSYFESHEGQYGQPWYAGFNELGPLDKTREYVMKRLFKEEWNQHENSSWGPMRNGYIYDFSNIKKMAVYKKFPVEFSPLWDKI